MVSYAVRPWFESRSGNRVTRGFNSPTLTGVPVSVSGVTANGMWSSW